MLMLDQPLGQFSEVCIQAFSGGQCSYTKICPIWRPFIYNRLSAALVWYVVVLSTLVWAGTPSLPSHSAFWRRTYKVKLMTSVGKRREERGRGQQ